MLVVCAPPFALFANLPPPVLPYPTALGRLLAQRFDWGTERVPLAEAGGRVLAEDLLADRDQPPFDRVAMDGVAIDHRAYAAGRRRFRVAGVLAAGEAATALPEAGACVEVMTGAVLPTGATAVVRYERISREGGAVRVAEELPAGADIHTRGRDAAAGQVLAPAGRRIGLGEVGTLATCGYAEVAVRRLPRATIIATGTELVPVGAAAAPHQIRASNVVQLRHLLREAGAEPDTELLRDDRAVLRKRISALLATHELLILTGGVSRGRHDHLPEVLVECGVRPLFHRVAQRPGKPLWAGRTDTALVLAMPGNPLAVIACALAYLGPYLRAGLGLPAPPRQARTLSRDLPAKPDFTTFLTVDAPPGTDVATPVRHAGSGDLASLLRTSGLLQLPAGRTGHYRAGERLAYLPLDSLL